MKQVIVFPRGQLSSKDKERLTRSGICAVEADDPSKVVTILPTGTVTGDMLAMAAMDAMQGHLHMDVRSAFAANLHAAIKSKQATKGDA